MIPEAQADCEGTGGGQAAPGVLGELSGALSAARAGFAGFLDVVSLEARRAGLALVWMAAAGLVAVVCLLVAWLGLLAALAMWATLLGLPAIAAVLAVAALNLAAAAVLIRVCIGASDDLRFTATRRQVAGTARGPAASP